MMKIAEIENPEKKNILPFKRSYWIIPGKFLAGALPSSPDSQERLEKCQGLLDVGIRAIINLMEPHEVDHEGRVFSSYEELFKDLGEKMETKVFFLRVPMRDRQCPSRETLLIVLDEIDRLLSEGLPVYVHCWGGIGRTGTVVGCWLARHGIARGEAVLEHISMLRRNDHPLPSPETDEQRRMVISWGEP